MERIFVSEWGEMVGGGCFLRSLFEILQQGQTPQVRFADLLFLF